MGFYDKEIKKLCERCPRLLILSVNSIFRKNHNLSSEVTFLDKEQPSKEYSTYMDMFFEIQGCKYHWEFQLLEGNMAIRMYEYGIKQTIRELTQKSNGEKKEAKYILKVAMPMQAVIFLAGANKKDRIFVELTLPDGQMVNYTLPCISASEKIDSLIGQELYLLLPFQQVQFHERMNQMHKRKEATKHRMASLLYDFHEQVKKNLEKLYEDGILTLNERNELLLTFMNVEQFIAEKDETVNEGVKQMGDKDYVSWSDRAEQRGLEKGLSQGLSQGELIKLIKQICRKILRGVDYKETADMLEESEETVYKIYQIAEKYAPEYDVEAIYGEYIREQ